MFSDEIEEAMAKAVVTSLVFMYGWIKDYSDAVTTDQDPSFLGALKEGFSLIRAIFVQLFISGLTILRQFSIISNVLSIMTVVLAIYGFIKVLSVIRKVALHSLKKKQLLLPVTVKNVNEAGSQTDSVLSLSLIAPLTKEFSDFFYKTLTDSGLKVYHGIIRQSSGEIPLELPLPRPMPWRLPLFGHTLDKKPPQTEKRGPETSPVYANISCSCQPRMGTSSLKKSSKRRPGVPPRSVKFSDNYDIHEYDVPNCGPTHHVKQVKSALGFSAGFPSSASNIAGYHESKSVIPECIDQENNIQFDHRAYKRHHNSYIPKSNMKFVNFDELRDAGEYDWPLQRTQSSCLSFQMDKENGVSAQNEWDKKLGLPPI